MESKGKWMTFCQEPNLKKLFAEGNISSDSHLEIRKFCEEFGVEKCHAVDYVKHLQLLKFRKEKRKESRDQASNKKSEIKYMDVNWDYYVKSGEIFNKLTVQQLNIYLKEHTFEQNEYRLPKKVKADRICSHYLFYENQKEDQETSAGLRQAEESSDSETENVVAELKSLSDRDTESEPDIPLDDAVERRTSFGRTRRFPQKYMDFLHEAFN